MYIQWENFIQRKRSTVRRRFTQGNCKEKFWVIYTNRRVVHESHSDLLSICNPQQNTSHNYKRCNKKVKGDKSMEQLQNAKNIKTEQIWVLS